MRQLLIQVILYNFQLIEQTPDAERSSISDVFESFLNFNALIAKKVPNAFDDPEVDCLKLVNYGNLHQYLWMQSYSNLNGTFLFIFDSNESISFARD